MSTNTDDSDSGGRWGRTPYRPEDLKEQYGTTESGRLDVTCPGCFRDFYPTPKCCVNRYAGDPFCPDCGTDFRTADPEEVREERLARYGTIAPVDELAESDALADEVARIVEESAATDGRITGTRNNQTVRVELEFEVDDAGFDLGVFGSDESDER